MEKDIQAELDRLEREIWGEDKDLSDILADDVLSDVDALLAQEAAEKAFISIHTVRKHNANIYQKLNVNSRDELMLYIDLFRRCGRLNELLS